MKHLIFLLLLILLLPLPAHAGPAAMKLRGVMGGVPMLLNSFETGTEGWNLGTGIRSNDPGRAYTGSYGIAFSGFGSSSMSKTVTMINPGTISFWYWTNEPGSFSGSSVAHSGGTTSFTGSSGAGSWIQLTASNIPAGTTTITINYSGFVNSSQFIDDVRYPQ